MQYNKKKTFDIVFSVQERRARPDLKKVKIAKGIYHKQIAIIKYYNSKYPVVCILNCCICLNFYMSY